MATHLDQQFLGRHRLPEPVYVARPTLPSLDDYRRLLEPSWERAWLTNRGDLHQELEARLAAWLGVEHLVLFNNGTIALLIGLRALGVGRGQGGKVITTPFTFPATPHAITWAGAEPVFVDVDPETGNLDPGRLEEAIDENTRAILPVHVYGRACDTEAIQEVATRHGVPVLYDAAHAMGASVGGRAVASFGDAAMLSFHATKLFTTAEGGALVLSNADLLRDTRWLRNFGIDGPEQVVTAGINGKMSELHAALGLLQLDQLEGEIESRRTLDAVYRQSLAEVPGLHPVLPPTGPGSNGAYFPVRVDAERYGRSRDQLHDDLQRCNIFPRKYFFPLCTHSIVYRDLPSARPERLPVAERFAAEVLCLPIYGSLDPQTAHAIVDTLAALAAA